jgi:ActR/RegA family two-component response regulator
MPRNEETRMSERVLFVDDEKFVLETFRRNLRRDFDIETAEGAEAALKLLERIGPVAVVVSDLKMPGMNGVELLEVVKNRWPDTVRIMLTGHADLDNAVSAVNKGAIFRFLIKPCAPDALLTAVSDGLNQYRLVTAERQLLHGTLRGSIHVLSELLSMVSPKAFGRAEKAKSLMAEMVQVLGLECSWKYELAAMLCMVGCISLPRDLLERKLAGKELSEEESAMYAMHPVMGGKLLSNIPRLEGVVEIVSEYKMPVRDNPCLGARMLKAALDFTDLVESGAAPADALGSLQDSEGVYDERIVSALKEVVARRNDSEILSLGMHELREGMLVMEPVRSRKNVILMDKGQVITFAALELFRNFGTILGVREPIYVLVRKTCP